MEEHLDSLLAVLALPGGSLSELRTAFERARTAAEAHYKAEEEVFRELGPGFAAFTAKLEDQHRTALELAGAALEALDRSQPGDAVRLARRFHAIAQHNVIEEERDLFPLLERPR